MLYRNRPVVVVGRSKDAPLEANYLAALGCQVTYVSPQAPVGLEAHIPFVRAGRLEILGEGAVTALSADGGRIPCDCVFILRETVVPTEHALSQSTQDGAIRVDRQMRTNLPGVFAAGDLYRKAPPDRKSGGGGPDRRGVRGR